MKIANVDGDVKRVAVVFEDHTLAINLYTGKDYVEYAQDTRRFSPYKANLMATYVKIPFAVAKDPEKGCYCICM